MILFKEDWDKPEYAKCIPDWDTTNETFLHYVSVLQELGIENRLWPLALHNPLLKGIDPHDPNLSIEEILMIVRECKENFWYFVREVIRIPIQGSLKPGEFKAHRGNMALFWTYHNHVTSMTLMPRQRGKTLGVNVIWVWVLIIAGQNTKIGLFTKDNDLRVTTVKQIKDIIDELPSYFNIRGRDDTNNTETITNKKLGNIYMTAVAQASIKAALNVFRGHSIPNIHNDETAFCVNNRTTIPAMLAAMTAARVNAANNGNPYGVLFTTTAGYLNSDTGIYAREIYDESLPWTERLLDTANQEDLYETIRNNNKGRLVEKNPDYKKRAPLQILLEFNHRQLGVTDEDFRISVENAKAEGDAVDADFLNKWVRGSDNSPIDPEILAAMERSVLETPDPYVTIEQTFMIRWYVSKNEVDNCLKNRKIVIGSDTSDGIGNDVISLVFLDLYTGEVVGVGDYSNVNLFQFANWLTTILIRFETSTLIMERKSSGMTILDILFLKLQDNNIDPLKRIYNRLVDEMNEIPEYADFLKTHFRYRETKMYNKYKSLYGYNTSGTGVHARDNIYYRAFHGTTTYLKDYIRDKELYYQFCNLVMRNNRIDHKPGYHDDLVFGILLAYWFATQAKNKSYYGIDPNMILRRIREKKFQENGGIEGERKRQMQERVLAQLELVRKAINSTLNELQLKELKHIYNTLVNKIEDKTIDIFDFDTLVKEMVDERKMRRIQ